MVGGGGDFEGAIFPTLALKSYSLKIFMIVGQGAGI